MEDKNNLNENQNIEENSHSKIINEEELFSSGSSTQGGMDIKERVKESFSAYKEEYTSTRDVFKKLNKKVKIKNAISLSGILLSFLGIAIGILTKTDLVVKIFAGCFFAFAIFTLISTIVLQRIHLRKPKKGACRKQATVLGCTESSSTTTGNKVKTIFYVALDIDGEMITSYCRQKLNENMKVNVYIENNNPRKYCYIDYNNMIYDMNGDIVQ